MLSCGSFENSSPTHTRDVDNYNGCHWYNSGFTRFGCVAFRGGLARISPILNTGLRFGRRFPRLSATRPVSVLITAQGPDPGASAPVIFILRLHTTNPHNTILVESMNYLEILVLFIMLLCGKEMVAYDSV